MQSRRQSPGVAQMESRGVDEVSARVRRDSWGERAEKQEGHQARECPGSLEKEGLTKQVSSPGSAKRRAKHQPLHLWQWPWAPGHAPASLPSPSQATCQHTRLNPTPPQCGPQGRLPELACWPQPLNSAGRPQPQGPPPPCPVSPALSPGCRAPPWLQPALLAGEDSLRPWSDPRWGEKGPASHPSDPSRAPVPASPRPHPWDGPES